MEITLWINGEFKMNKYIMLFVFLLIAFSLEGRERLMTSQRNDPDYIKLADSVAKRYAFEFTSKQGLQLVGYGGAMMENVKEYDFSFQKLQRVDVNEARFQIVDCVVELLRRVNEARPLRPYLAEYPFTDKNLRFSIMYIDRRGDFVGEGYISTVSMFDGNIYYRVNRKTVERLSSTIHEETFADAVRRVQEMRDRFQPS